ncbi:hypothetical protein OBV_24060 [Oscillibacter valericigenes Sjm18-20]|nr:hypothetical protein OBV_24060 [Oscillibacter valericigenes Sjm18-20]
MKKFQECLWEVRTERCAEEQKRERRRQKQDREFLAKLFLRMLFLLLLAAVLGAVLFHMEPSVVRNCAKLGTVVCDSSQRSVLPPSSSETRCAGLSDEVWTEDAENEKIEVALLAKAHKMEDCTVTWYTADTCNKKPGDPGYGITYSGLPVVEHLTCAVDRDVIPLYSDVFVRYADGSMEQLWATDTGISGKAIDIYTPSYNYAIQCGRQSLTVWWVEPPEDTR